MLPKFYLLFDTRIKMKDSTIKDIIETENAWNLGFRKKISEYIIRKEKLQHSIKVI